MAWSLKTPEVQGSNPGGASNFLHEIRRESHSEKVSLRKIGITKFRARSSGVPTVP